MSTETYTNVPLMAVPDELRWAVSKLIDLHTAGWEVSGYQGWGGPKGKTQHVKVDFRRRKDA